MSGGVLLGWAGGGLPKARVERVQSAMWASKTAEWVTKAIEWAAYSMEETTKAVAETRQSIVETTQSIAETAKTIVEMTQTATWITTGVAVWWVPWPQLWVAMTRGWWHGSPSRVAARRGEPGHRHGHAEPWPWHPAGETPTPLGELAKGYVAACFF